MKDQSKLDLFYGATIFSQKKIEIATCTQQSQKWGKLTKDAGMDVLEPQRIKSMPQFVNVVRKEYIATEEEVIIFREKLLSGTIDL